MFCRVCGHNNKGRDTGPCDSCGFSLDEMNRPLKEMRASLQQRVKKPAKFQERVPLRLHSRSMAGLLGFAVFCIGLIATLLIVNSYDRSTRLIGDESGDLAAVAAEEESVDSLPIRMDADLVYVLNAEGTGAMPHTNLNLNMMPEGATICIVGPPELSIRPVVNYLAMKKAEIRGTLVLEKLACWDDSTQTSFREVPLWVQPENEDVDSLSPVVVKFLFLEEWLVGRSEEMEIDVPAPLPSGFTEAKLDSVLYQVSRRLERNSDDIGDREIQVAALFPDTTTLATAMDRMEMVYPKVDTLGYRAFDIKWFRLED